MIVRAPLRVRVCVHVRVRIAWRCAHIAQNGTFALNVWIRAFLELVDTVLTARCIVHLCQGARRSGAHSAKHRANALDVHLHALAGLVDAAPSTCCIIYHSVRADGVRSFLLAVRGLRRYRHLCIGHNHGGRATQHCHSEEERNHLHAGTKCVLRGERAGVLLIF